MDTDVSKPTASMLRKRTRFMDRVNALIGGQTPLGPFMHIPGQDIFVQEFPLRPPHYNGGKAGTFPDAIALEGESLYEMDDLNWRCLIRGHPGAVLRWHVDFRGKPALGGLLDPGDKFVTPGLDGRLKE